MNNDLKTKSLSMVIMILAVLILGYFVVVSGWNKLSSSQAEMKRVELDQKNLDEALSAVQKFLERFKTLDEQALVAGIALPTQSNPAVLLGNIESLAAASGLAISSVNITEPNKEDLEKIAAYALVPLQVDLSVAGSFISFRDFLGKLEQNIRLMDVELVNASVEENNPNMVYQLRFNTYYQK